MNNSVNGDLGPKKVEPTKNNAEPISERDRTEEFRLRSLFEKEVLNSNNGRGVAPDGKKIAEEARKKGYGNYNDGQLAKSIGQSVKNYRRTHNSNSVFGK